MQVGQGIAKIAELEGVLRGAFPQFFHNFHFLTTGDDNTQVNLQFFRNF